MGQEKPMISYRMNGKEICREINFFNQFKIYKEINPREIVDYRDQFYFNEDIEWIHFKNVEFNSTTKQCFLLQEHQVLILENCTFHGWKIEFQNGFIEVLSPHILRQGVLPNFLKANWVQDLSIQLNAGEENFLNIQVEEGKRFSLRGNSHLNYLDVDARCIDLDGLKGQMSELRLIGDEIRLGNQVDVTAYLPIRIEANSVYFDRSFLKSRSDILLDVNRINENRDSFALMAGHSIDVNGNVYWKKMNHEYVVVTDLDLVGKRDKTRELISSLKGIQRLLEQAQEDKILEMEEQIRCSFARKSVQDCYQKLRFKK